MALDVREDVLTRPEGSVAVTAILCTTQAIASEATERRPFEGRTVNVLTAKSSRFEAHDARPAAFEEATGIDVVYDQVPFPGMKEALTIQMVAGGGDCDVVSLMDQRIPSLGLPVRPIGAQIAAQDSSDAAGVALPYGKLSGQT